MVWPSTLLLLRSRSRRYAKACLCPYLKGKCRVRYWHADSVHSFPRDREKVGKEKDERVRGYSSTVVSSLTLIAPMCRLYYLLSFPLYHCGWCGTGQRSRGRVETTELIFAVQTARVTDLCWSFEHFWQTLALWLYGPQQQRKCMKRIFARTAKEHNFKKGIDWLRYRDRFHRCSQRPTYQIGVDS